MRNVVRGSGRQELRRFAPWRAAAGNSGGGRAVTTMPLGDYRCVTAALPRRQSAGYGDRFKLEKGGEPQRDAQRGPFDQGAGALGELRFQESEVESPGGNGQDSFHANTRKLDAAKQHLPAQGGARETGSPRDGPARCSARQPMGEFLGDAGSQEKRHAMMKLNLLGGQKLTTRGVDRVSGGPIVAQPLDLRLLRPGSRVPRPVAAGSFWPETVEDPALNSFHTEHAALCEDVVAAWRTLAEPLATTNLAGISGPSTKRASPGSIVERDARAKQHSKRKSSMNVSQAAESIMPNTPKSGAGEHLVSIQRGPDCAAVPQRQGGSTRQRYPWPCLIPVEVIDEVQGTRRAGIQVLESSLAAEATKAITDNKPLAKFTVGTVGRIIEFDGLTDGILGGATEPVPVERADHAADAARAGACRVGDRA